MIDHTHDPNLKSWIESANAPKCDFPIQNLPYGVFLRDDLPDDLTSHVGVAIGEQVLDLTFATELGVLDVPEGVVADLSVGILNELMANDPAVVRQLRLAVSDLLRHDNPRLRNDREARTQLLVPMSDVQLELPVIIGDYTDFYASIHHATNVGSMFRPDNPLMPNYTHLPVGYHGRASSIVISGTPIRRPHGQTKADDAELPTYGPCRLLDYELEMGFFVGQGNAMGEPITMAQASGGGGIFGMVIVNDWSARDVQKWEYQPLGPFNAKNFATSISPWVVTLDALAPFRIPGPPRGDDHPPIIDYLRPADDMSLDIHVSVHITSETMRAEGIDPVEISRGNFREMYWTIAQMLAHHSSTGCNMRPGDLLASGTVSGPDEHNRGCLLERTWRGQHPIDLPDGTQRKFLQDGDEVIIRAYCETDGATRIGFGECRGIVTPAG